MIIDKVYTVQITHNLNSPRVRHAEDTRATRRRHACDTQKTRVIHAEDTRTKLTQQHAWHHTVRVHACSMLYTRVPRV